MTMHKDQIFQWGGTPVGSGVSYGWKVDSDAIFVDGTQGGDEKNGSSPKEAVATVEKAITLAGPYDVIYITEKSFSGTDPTTYIGATANHTIPVANLGMAIVGVSHAGMLGYPMTPYLMGLAATETPIFTVNAPLVAIENLHFSGNWANANTTTAGIYAPNSTGFTTQVPQALSVYNCSFEDLEGAAPTQGTTAPGGGISIQGTWYTVVNHCRFRNCVVGIQVISAASTTVATTLEHCIFFADAATDVNADIIYYCQGTSDLLINDMYFAHKLPAYASGSAARYIQVAAGTQGLITNCYLGGVQNVTLTAGPGGTGISTDSTAIGLGHNWSDGEAVLYAS